MLNEYGNNLLVICSNSYKKELLKQVKELVNIKFIDMNEFIKSYYFDYDEKSVLYLINNYNLKYDIALEYLNNLIYVEDKKYESDKLNFLVKIKKELIENGLLIFNNKFKNYIKNKTIIVYKYSLSKFEKHLLEGINYKVVDEDNKSYIPKVYEFDSMEDEVSFIAKEISQLINSGVPINKIKLTNVSNDYIEEIHKIFDFYNLKINKFINIPLIATIVGKTFISNISSIEEAVNSIEKYKDTETYKKIINICNKYIWCKNNDDLKVLIKYDLNHTYIDNIKYTNSIEVVDYKNITDDNYIFLLGANLGVLPKVYKDEDYITDSIKPSYVDTVVEKNIKEKNDTIKAIKNIKNLVITYKLKDDFNTYYPTNLIDELNLKVERPINDYSISYSEILDKLRLASYLDNLIKFGKKSDNLNILNSNYDIPYNTYTHEFTGLDKLKLQSYIKSLKNFNLSYTHMDNYNRCAFRFYINKILNLNNNEDSIGIILGNIYHDVLEKAVKEEVDVKKEVNDYIEKNQLKLTNSNSFFINRAIKNIEYVIETIKKQNSFSNLKEVETEKFVRVPIKDNINFVGFIDKIVYNKSDAQTIASIIDYKTYVKKPSLKYIDYGIGLQLPTYMYLSKNSFENIRFAGFYLQNITLDNKSTEEKERSLKLIGFTNKDKDILKEFDLNYKDSSVIDGIKVNKDGSFSSNSLKHMLSDEEMNSIVSLTHKKIIETANNVLDSKFDINPKYDNGNIGCEFCEYKDLCFMREYDFVKIKSNDEFGGEDDE